MKYNVNINQKALNKVAPSLNLVHDAIIDEMKSLCNSKSDVVKKNRVEIDGEEWTWISLSRVIEDLPRLPFSSTSTVSDYVSEICKTGLFEKRRLKGNRLYVKPTKMLDKTEYGRADSANTSDENTEKQAESDSSDSRIRQSGRQNPTARTDNNISDNKHPHLSKENPLKGEKEKVSSPNLTPKEFNESFFNRNRIWDKMLSMSKREANAPPNAVEQEFQKFWSYWTEPNKSGTKERWEMESTFDVKRRLGTWFRRADDFNSQKSKGKKINV